MADFFKSKINKKQNWYEVIQIGLVLLLVLMASRKILLSNKFLMYFFDCTTALDVPILIKM